MTPGSNWTMTPADVGKIFSYDTQERVCSKCGYIQREKLIYIPLPDEDDDGSASHSVYN